MLQEFNAKNAQFRILPQYKVKSEGEVVSVTLLTSFKQTSQTRIITRLLKYLACVTLRQRCIALDIMEKFILKTSSFILQYNVKRMMFFCSRIENQ